MRDPLRLVVLALGLSSIAGAFGLCPTLLGGPRPPAPPRAHPLTRRVEHAFSRVDASIDHGTIDEQVAAFVRLRELLEEARKRPDLAERVRRWELRLGDTAQARRALVLHLYTLEAERSVAALTDAVQSHDRERADAVEARLQDLAEQMRAEDEEVFHRHADALERRARELLARAR